MFARCRGRTGPVPALCASPVVMCRAHVPYLISLLASNRPARRPIAMPPDSLAAHASQSPHVPPALKPSKSQRPHTTHQTALPLTPSFHPIVPALLPLLECSRDLAPSCAGMRWHPPTRPAVGLQRGTCRVPASPVSLRPAPDCCSRALEGARVRKRSWPTRGMHACTPQVGAHPHGTCTAGILRVQDTAHARACGRRAGNPCIDCMQHGRQGGGGGEVP